MFTKKINIHTQTYQIKILYIKQTSTKNLYTHLLLQFMPKYTKTNMYTYNKFIVKPTISNLFSVQQLLNLILYKC